MSSIKDRAREAQAARLGLEKDAPEDSELLSMAENLYNGVDALSEEQKTLLVRDALMKVSGLLEMIGNAPNPGIAAGYGAVAHAIIALAGYANETTREAAGYTSTGDTKVEAVLDGVRGLLGKFAEVSMSPEQRDLSDKIGAKVKERVAAGEDYGTVVADELAKHRKEVAEVEGQEIEAPAASDRYSTDRLYL